MGTKRSGSLLRILMYVWIEVILWQPDKFIITELMAMHECGQSGTCLFGTGLCVSTRLFTLNTLIISFHWIYLWIHVWHRDKNPQLGWRFSANRSKASFNSVHRSAVEPGLNAVFFSFFFFPSCDRNNAKYALQFSFHDPTVPRAFRVKAESKPVHGGQRLGPRNKV